MLSEADRAREIDANFEAFQAMLPALMETDRGRYALMRSREIVGLFDTAGETLNEAFSKFPDERYSIQQVTGPACLGWYSYVENIS